MFCMPQLSMATYRVVGLHSHLRKRVANSICAVNTLTSATVANSFCGAYHGFATEQACNVDPCPTYTWQAGSWGPCSSPCNTGFETRTVDCISSVGNVVVPTGCDPTVQPVSQQPCNTQACTGAHWASTAWGTCTQTCGGGTQTRTVNCEDVNNAVVPTTSCTCAEPPTQQTCSLVACDTYYWDPCSTFYPCTAQCNGGGAMVGVQYRDVFCKRASDNTVVDNSLCNPATMPTTALSVCNTQPCTNYNWMANANWGACTLQTNGLYQRTRSFHCHAKDGTTCANSLCTQNAGPQPISVLPCSPGTCGNANGCPTVDIGQVLTVCQPSDLTNCDPNSQCGEAANNVDLTVFSVGMTVATAEACFDTFISTMASPPDPSLVAEVKSKLQAGQKLCGVGGSTLSDASTLAPFAAVYLGWLLF